MCFIASPLFQQAHQSGLSSSISQTCKPTKIMVLIRFSCNEFFLLGLNLATKKDNQCGLVATRLTLAQFF
jgi:hypothetical protein